MECSLTPHAHATHTIPCNVPQPIILMISNKIPIKICGTLEMTEYYCHLKCFRYHTYLYYDQFVWLAMNRFCLWLAGLFDWLDAMDDIGMLKLWLTFKMALLLLLIGSTYFWCWCSCITDNDHQMVVNSFLVFLLIIIMIRLPFSIWKFIEWYQFHMSSLWRVYTDRLIQWTYNIVKIKFAQSKMELDVACSHEQLKLIPNVMQLKWILNGEYFHEWNWAQPFLVSTSLFCVIGY